MTRNHNTVACSVIILLAASSVLSGSDAPNNPWEFNKKVNELEMKSSASNADLARACKQYPQTEHIVCYKATDGDGITSLEPLALLANLKRIKLWCMGMGGRRWDMGPFAKLEKLEELNCHGTWVSNTDALKGLKSLKKVNFSLSNPESIDFAAELPNLEELNLWGADKFKDFTPLTGLKKLKNLQLYHNSAATDENLAVLETLTSLETFANSSNYRVTHLNFLLNCKNLKVLNNRSGNIKDLSGISGLNLENLVLERCPIKDLTPLKDMTKLKSLNLNHTKVTDLSPLTSCSNLESLQMEKVPVRDLSPLKELSNLRKLYVSKDIPQAQIDAVKKALPTLEVKVKKTR